MQPILTITHLSNEPRFRHEHDAGGSGAVAKVGVGLRLFVIFNRGYKPMCFVANDIAEAQRIAFSVGHSRKPGAFRRWDDVTEKALINGCSELYGDPDMVQRALNAGRSGVWCRQPDGQWTLAGKPVT